MKEINSFKKQQQCNLVCTNLGANHCDLHIQHSGGDEPTEKVRKVDTQCGIP